MIVEAVKSAYATMEKRGWDRLYWAIDLHGVCLKSNYTHGEYEFISDEAIECLREISSRPESVLILWTSTDHYSMRQIRTLFFQHGISVHYFNSNPEVGNTSTGFFDEKFYFNVLLDDKAGFNPDRDWTQILNYLKEKK